MLVSTVCSFFLRLNGYLLSNYYVSTPFLGAGVNRQKLSPFPIDVTYYAIDGKGNSKQINDII